MEFGIPFQLMRVVPLCLNPIPSKAPHQNTDPMIMADARTPLADTKERRLKLSSQTDGKIMRATTKTKNAWPAILKPKSSNPTSGNMLFKLSPSRIRNPVATKYSSTYMKTDTTIFPLFPNASSPTSG